MSTAITDERWAETCERLQDALTVAVETLNATADQLDSWVEQSRKGGWSTHQVDPMVAKANDLRRTAAKLRQKVNHG